MATTNPNAKRQHLERVTITGFKSIDSISVKLKPGLNILIGANGSGKSNFIETFAFVHTMVSQRLQRYVADKGGADAILHFGRDTTNSMHIKLEYFVEVEDNIIRAYEVHLRPNEQDKLFITSEISHYHDRDKYPDSYDNPIARNQFESGLADDTHRTSREMLDILNAYRIYHFHDASPSSPPRRQSKRADSQYLKSNGSNLAAWLYHLKEMHSESFDLIESLVRQVSPFFGAFVLRTTDSAGLHIRLEWEARDRDDHFDVAAMSDGTVRFICLACLLLQPNPPPLILIDEPELGLHPKAVTILAGMLRSASAATQLIVSTQSVTLVNHFDRSHVWCVDHIDDGTSLRSLANKRLIGWLEGYGVGDAWENNLVWENNGVLESGGGP